MLHFDVMRNVFRKDMIALFQATNHMFGISTLHNSILWMQQTGTNGDFI
jgi:hypothetical protein